MLKIILTSFIVYIGYLCLVMLFSYIYSVILASGKLKKIIWSSFILGIIFSLFTLFSPHFPQLITENETAFMKFAGDLRHKNDDYKFVKDNFILMDVSYNKQLIPKGETTIQDSWTTITNRKLLADFFKLTNSEIDNIDLVVCDIGFNDRTDHDKVLKSQMDKVFYKDKLLVSTADNKNPDLFFPEEICGSVIENTNEKLFTVHTIIKKDGSVSLPCKIYEKLKDVKEVKRSWFPFILIETGNGFFGRLAMNRFLPEFTIIKEDSLTFIREDSSGNPNSDRNYFEVGNVLKDSLIERSSFVDILSARKKNGKKNIILLGSFRGEDDDVHETAYGSLHGTTIILNTVNQLVLKQHVVSFVYFLTLVIGFTIISLVFFMNLGVKVRQEKKGWAKKLLNFKQDLKQTRLFVFFRRTEKNKRFEFFKLLGEMMFNESHYFLIYFFLWGVWIMFGHMANMLSIFVILAVVETGLKFFFKKFIR